ncbi:hypothetical protein [Halorubellus litoreus]|uniref:Tat (Twin-arginine translocation) pathway signal sequence n=1 Tax=Halorubellus litoreus TaxID=755308 RepID=A0ABD5V7K3_9EURY
MAKRHGFSRRNIVKGIGGVSALSAISGLSTASEKDEPILQDEELSRHREVRHANKTRNLSDFKTAVSEVSERGYTVFGGRSGLKRSGQMLEDEIVIISYNFESRESGQEAEISVSFNAYDEPVVGIRFADSSGVSIQGSNDTNSEYNYFLVEQNELSAPESHSLISSAEDPITTLGNGSCHKGSHVATISGNDVCYVLDGLALAGGTAITLASPLPGDEVMAYATLAEVTQQSGCFLYDTAKREFESRGKDCDNVMFDVCIYQPTIFSTPLIYVEPSCHD